MVREGKGSVAQIAKKHGVTRDTVRRWSGVSSRSTKADRERAARHEKRLSPKDKAKLKAAKRVKSKEKAHKAAKKKLGARASKEGKKVYVKERWDSKAGGWTHGQGYVK